MTKYLLTFVTLLSPMFVLGQSKVEIDTIRTIDFNSALIAETTYAEDGTRAIQVMEMLIDGTSYAVPDTTIVLTKKENKSTFFNKKEGEQIFYTKLPDGGRYESSRTGYVLTKEDKIKILRSIYGNIKYPERAIEGNIEGRFQLEFYLNTSGCIQDILLIGSARSLLVNEAKRAAMKCDCQFPVLQKGESKFPTKLLLPMKFALE